LARAPGSQVPSMAFASGMQARLPLGPLARGFLTTLQASLHAADRSVARPLRGGLPPPRRRDLARRRECCYRGPWRLPGPDSHRLAAVSLPLGYVVVLLLSVVLGARATGRTFARNHPQPQPPRPRGAARWPAVVDRVDVHAGRHHHARAPGPSPPAPRRPRADTSAGSWTPLIRHSPPVHRTHTPVHRLPHRGPHRLLRPATPLTAPLTAPLTQPLSAALTGRMRPGSPPL
jgi:hypothetical protein